MRNSRRRNQLNSTRVILPTQSITIGAAETFLPPGAILLSIKGENDSGPEWAGNITFYSYGGTALSTSLKIIAKNGVAASVKQHYSYQTNVAAKAVATGQQALSITADQYSILRAYYML